MDKIEKVFTLIYNNNRLKEGLIKKQTIDEMYEYCTSISGGYTKEEFRKFIDEMYQYVKEELINKNLSISDEDIKKVSGGLQLNNKAISSLLAAITVSTPFVGAAGADNDQKNDNVPVENKTSIAQKIKNFVFRYPITSATGAASIPITVILGIMLRSKHKEQERLEKEQKQKEEQKRQEQERLEKEAEEEGQKREALEEEERKRRYEDQIEQEEQEKQEESVRQKQKTISENIIGIVNRNTAEIKKKCEVLRQIVSDLLRNDHIPTKEEIAEAEKKLDDFVWVFDVNRCTINAQPFNVKSAISLPDIKERTNKVLEEAYKFLDQMEKERDSLSKQIETARERFNNNQETRNTLMNRFF